MRVASVALRNFRTYDTASTDFGEGLTVVTGPNGAGKTNLLEAVYFGCTGRSCRTANDRELVRFGAPAARVVVSAVGDDGQHELAVGFAPGAPKRMSVDGVAIERLLDSPARPLVSVFLPDRLDLIKGVPSGRRAHLDQFVAAIWPARVVARRAYAQTLAQRNALLGRIRAGLSSRGSLATWDERLAEAGLHLMADRREAVTSLSPAYAEIANDLGLDGEVEVGYAPRSKAHALEEFVEELEARAATDLDRGFTSHGPHRDDLRLTHNGRELRTYGSQGQQRLALLSLLLDERRVLTDRRDAAPLLLLDDVMSELDSQRRAALVDVVCASPGQAVITTTDPEHVPEVGEHPAFHIRVSDGCLLANSEAVRS
jgi:DNA replication and repair protein RecF